MIHTHGELQDLLEDIKPRNLRCIRMMGTLIGAASVPAPGKSDAEGEAEMEVGLIRQTAQHLLENWDNVQSMLLIGSRNDSVPMDQAPYQFYTYLFVSRVVQKLVEELEQPEAGVAKDQLDIRFTFVPEDILFAQFFYDEDYLVIAASYGWRTQSEFAPVKKVRGQKSAYAAMFLDNRKGVGKTPRLWFPRTSNRLIRIFDARYREQAETLGEEVWTLKRLEDRSYAVGVRTRFWRTTDSILQPFEFSNRDLGETFELGKNTLDRFVKYVQDLIGPPPAAPGDP